MWIQEDTTCWVDFICGSCKGDDDNIASTISTSINVDNIETEDTGTISSIVRACDTDVSQQNRTHNTNLAKIPKSFIEINSRRMNYFGKAL